jgi:transcriptional regulator with XRE-family HTH domain
MYRFVMATRPRKKATAKTEPTAAEIFGKNLRAARLSAGMTQAQVAYASGLSLNRMALIERGKSNARLSSARALARAVGVPLSGLVGD